MKFKFLLLLLLPVIFGAQRSKAQNYMPVSTKLDEAALTLNSGTVVVDDPTAEGGKAIFRPSGAAANTMFFGPYKQFQAGNYLIQFRMKVASNVSGNRLLSLDVVPSQGPYQPFPVTANMFRNSNEWQLITLPVRLTSESTAVEIRGISFAPGTTDLYLDYISIIPGDERGFYSNEYTLTGTGNLGLGTITPTAKLHVVGNGLVAGDFNVAGNIKTKKIKVTVTDWPDYVFESDYHLPGLSELELYIQQHKHLPDVIPASVANSEGIDVSETQAMLLKKIEELTRYIIDQDKRIKAQDRRIDELEKKAKP